MFIPAVKYLPEPKIKQNLEDLIEDKETKSKKTSIMKKKLSFKGFLISITIIFILSLSFLAGLYYLLNIQYVAPKLYSPTGGPITSAPKTLRLDLQQPDNDTLTYDSSILVSGKTAPFLDVIIFSQTKDVLIKSGADGSFSTIFNLDEGENKLQVVIFDKTGDSRSDKRSVYFSKEKIQ